MIRLKLTSDNGYEDTYLANQVIDAEHKVYLFVKLIDFREVLPESEIKDLKGHYNCSIVCVSEGFLKENHTVEQIENDLGFDGWSTADVIARHEMLAEHGWQGLLWQSNGNNKEALLKAARKELMPISMLFGFYADRPVNAIGNTSWDFMRGQIGFHS